MFSRLDSVEARFVELESRLADPTLADRPGDFRKLSQEHADLREVVEEYRLYKRLTSELASNKELLLDSDASMSALAKEEVRRLEPEVGDSKSRLEVLLLPKDPMDQKNVVLEVRAGAGGDEAGLFAAELFRAYQRYGERQGWRVEVLSTSSTGIGGVKEIIASVTGERVYSSLKWEGGVHRVQRVPKTEAQGRVHTSTVTVAVLPEAEEVDVTINPADLRIDVFRSGGAGGQGVNTTDSAVRITHLPSGVVVVCQDERSQHKNRDKAMKILRSRLLDAAVEKAASEHSAARRTMVGTGDRSERIRTYNFPQGRVTDHRIGLTVHQIDDVMQGHLDEVIKALRTYHQVESLKAQGITQS